MSDVSWSDKCCADCMFHELHFSEEPCAPCSMYSNFEPALKEGDLIVLAGAWHRVAHADGMYWLHRNLPAHNLQIFFDAGMSAEQAEEFFRAIDPSIVFDYSWPCMSMLQLVRCVHAIRNDARFNKSDNPVTVEDTRMTRESKTFKNAEELIENELQENDIVVFTVLGNVIKYEVRQDYLNCTDGSNDRIFEVLGADKECMANDAYGYDPGCGGVWPYSATEDYAALTRLCLALYEKIDPTPVVLKSAADVLKYGLKHGTKIIFPGATTAYKVEGRPEVFSYGLYLGVPGCRANDYIFDELKLDKDQFCGMMYGYEAKAGSWPETDGEDYAALTRAVVCLMYLAEARETDKVKNLRVKLAELVAQRESYEEDVQAAKQAVQEATEALDQARSDLSYEEGELETLQEDIDELEEAIKEALEGK